MPSKGMRNFFSHSKAPSFSVDSSPSRCSVSFPTPRRIPVTNFTGALVDEILQNAAVLVEKWNPESSSFGRITCMFYESKREAHEFIKCVNDLQRVMHFLVSDDPASQKLVHAHRIMQIAMKRMQKEFHQILSMNRDNLDPESVTIRSRCSTCTTSSDETTTDDDDVRFAGEYSIAEVDRLSSEATMDLKSIAECMISCGYAKECVRIYKIIRKSIMDQAMYKLGVERMDASKIHKMDKESLELKIKRWLNAVKVFMTSLFNGEMILCDAVFAVSNSIRESCFTHIVKEAAVLLFGFPQVLVAKSKKNHFREEIIFYLLDMYAAISGYWPEIVSMFAFESTIRVQSEALNSLVRLSESVRSLLSDFETAIQKDSSKSPVDGGGVHPLTLHVMTYLSLLADYSNVLVDMFADWPPQSKLPLPESYFDSPESDNSPLLAISVRMAWLILVLVCKLDDKAKHYEDISLSYLFLANNLQHMVSTVRESNLRSLLGEEWIAKNQGKVRKFAANYERLAWGNVINTLPKADASTLSGISSEQARLIFRNFNFTFEETFRKQKSSIVPDVKLREEIKASVTNMIVSVYKEFYDAHKTALRSSRNVTVYVRFSPRDIRDYLSELY